mmetsp:Transcript_6532/g.26201  ORF Transcript_6532/g.26201 Transcript_6532/m.26201 type:complete len:239 (+) Transcript_6532:2903-3619(+)
MQISGRRGTNLRFVTATKRRFEKCFESSAPSPRAFPTPTSTSPSSRRTSTRRRRRRIRATPWRDSTPPMRRTRRRTRLPCPASCVRTSKARRRPPPPSLSTRATTPRSIWTPWKRPPACSPASSATPPPPVSAPWRDLRARARRLQRGAARANSKKERTNLINEIIKMESIDRKSRNLYPNSTAHSLTLSLSKKSRLDLAMGEAREGVRERVSRRHDWVDGERETVRRRGSEIPRVLS